MYQCTNVTNAKKRKNAKKQQLYRVDQNKY